MEHNIEYWMRRTVAQPSWVTPPKPFLGKYPTRIAYRVWRGGKVVADYIGKPAYEAHEALLKAVGAKETAPTSKWRFVEFDRVNLIRHTGRTEVPFSRISQYCKMYHPQVGSTPVTYHAYPSFVMIDSLRGYMLFNHYLLVPDARNGIYALGYTDDTARDPRKLSQGALAVTSRLSASLIGWYDSHTGDGLFHPVNTIVPPRPRRHGETFGEWLVRTQGYDAVPIGHTGGDHE